MKKILHLCVEEHHGAASFGGGIGGYATYTKRLKAYESQFRQADYLNVFCPVTRPMNPRYKLLNDPYKLAVDLAKYASALLLYRPDVVHVHGLYWRSIYREVFFVFLARLFAIPVLYEARGGSFWRCVQSTGIVGRMAGFVLRQSSALTVQGVSDQQKLNSLRADVLQVPNYISPPLERLSRSNLKDRSIDFAFLGYVSQHKNVPKLIELAELLPESSFVFIGEVDEHIRRLEAPGNCRFTGRLPQAAGFETLQNAKYFLFLSRMAGEGQPNAVLEAIWAGCVPICYNHGFISDLVQDPRLLLPVECEDAQEIVRRIEDIRSVPVSDFSTSLKATVEKTSSAGEAEHLMEIYSKLLRGRSRCR